MTPLVVAALGGNAILPKGARGEAEEQWSTVRRAARALIPILEDGARLVVTHGNGPQAGYLVEAFESLPPEKPRQPLYLAVAMTQGWLGFIIQHALELEARKKGLNLRVAALVSRVEVSRRDPAFQNPTKFIGGYYSREEAERLAREKGWVFKRDPRGGYRRVVPSPRPIRVLESDTVARLVGEGIVVVAAGGGGIPVDEDMAPVDAVVDKDLASYVLAKSIGASHFIILTDVPGVALDYGTPRERWLRELDAEEALRLVEEGVFPPGSMGPKVEAAARFALETGGYAAIGLLDEAYRVYKGEAGTVIRAGANRL